MRKFAFVLAAFGALVQPVFAETAWEKIEHGIDVVKECADDARQYCKEVKPGDGRIKACMTEHLAGLSGACLKALGETKPAAAAGLADPCEVKGDRNWRGNAFYEILFMNRDAKGPGGVGNYYNSIGNSFNVSNEVLDARFLALDAEKLKKEYGSDGSASMARGGSWRMASPG